MSSESKSLTIDAAVAMVENAKLAAGVWTVKQVRHEAVLRKAAELKAYLADPIELLNLKVRDAIKAALKGYKGGPLPVVTYKLVAEDMPQLPELLVRLKAGKAGVDAILDETEDGMQAMLLAITLPNGDLENPKKK